MRRDRRFAHLDGVWAALGLTVVMAARSPCAARADQKHVVRAGQSLGVIARDYGSTVASLAAENGLNPDGILREGQVLRIPVTRTHKVRPGQTLGQLARDYQVSRLALASANHLDLEAKLQIDQVLVLPPGAVSSKSPANSGANSETSLGAAAVRTGDAEEVQPGDKLTAAKVSTDPVLIAAAAASGKPRAGKSASKSSKWPWGKPAQLGVVSLYRIWSKESLRVKLVDGRGRPRQDARRALREFLRPRDSQRRKTPNARLLSLLAKVSDHFGGRPLHIVSGYRIAKGLTRKTSRHVAGEAIDFRIPGVPLTVLRDYCQQFPDVGVGYYPTTEFVHLDVRKQPARWTDWSLPGQAPVLIKPSEADENPQDEVIAEPPSDTTAERTGEEADDDAPAG